MSLPEYQLPDWARGFKGLLRVLLYKAVFMVGLFSAILNALVFIFGPGAMRESSMGTSWASFGVLLAVVAILSGLSVACYFATQRMEARWPGISILSA